MGRIIRWSLLFIAVTFLTAVVEPHFVDFLTDLGWYDNPASTLDPVVNWIARIVGDSAFPWVAGFVFGLTAGVWLHWLAGRFDSNRPTKSSKIMVLGDRIESIRDELREYVINLSHNQKPLPNIVPGYLSTKVNSLHISLKEIGIWVPDKIEPSNPSNYIGMNIFYFMELAELANYGHYNAAKKRAKEISKELETIDLSKPNFISSDSLQRLYEEGG